MDRNAVMRAALWATCCCNLGGALLFAFPASLGQLAGLPLPAQRVYAWFIAFIIAAFGGVYAWLARRSAIDRAPVALGAIGKTGFSAVVFACWLLDELPARALVLALGDLAFAGIFVWWLLAETTADASPSAVPPAGGEARPSAPHGRPAGPGVS